MKTKYVQRDPERPRELAAKKKLVNVSWTPTEFPYNQIPVIRERRETRNVLLKE